MAKIHILKVRIIEHYEGQYSLEDIISQILLHELNDYQEDIDEKLLSNIDQEEEEA